MCLFYLVSGLPTPDGVGRCWGGAGWGVCCRKGDRPKRAIAAARTGSDGVARKSRTAQWHSGHGWRALRLTSTHGRRALGSRWMREAVQ